MPRSDDTIEQIRVQRKGEPENVGLYLARKELEKIPFAGLAIEFVRGKNKDEKEAWFDNAVLDVLANHEVSLDKINEKLESENVKRVIASAVEEIFWGASTAKVRRFASVVASVIEFDKSDQELEDAIAFIRALDELTEDDMKVLKHLYCHQSHLVSERHAMTYNSFFQNNGMVNMLMDARELGLQMDDFFSRCSRLTGYGLALELNTKHGTMGNLDDFAFRLTLLGKRLIEMLRSAGEEIQVTKRKPQ
jgi:hypothetical protein